MSGAFRPSLKEKLGCWANERWRTELALALPEKFQRSGICWESLCNRNETLKHDEHTNGYSCDWEDTSRLTVAHVFPRVGARLLQKCLLTWPVRFATEVSAIGGDPEVSIVLGVRGLGRLPQFRATLASLMGQINCVTEIIVVEQSWEQCFLPEIPLGVRYIFTKISHPDMPFNRSWALNVGTRAARGRVIVLHDADMIAPCALARAVADNVRGTVDGMRIPRFLFYLDKESSQRVIENRDFSSLRSIDTVVQNNRTPIAMTQDALMKIGGHDEAFFGWGGEDNEFIDRARTLNFREGAIFPLVHLWHEVPAKKLGDRNRGELDKLMRLAPSIRVTSLLGREFGGKTPAVAWQQAKEEST